jgi:tetratricopeptide (TPR) repeat protein/transcriptional regulator with XRE-family HTH domain
VTFGKLLRQLRTDAGLTQEELAEAAGISPRSVSDLERGINLTARKDTARLLADALRLTGGPRADFEAVASGRTASESVAGAAAATRTLPRDIGSFTGREPELRALVNAAADAEAGPGGVIGIYAIGGMAGIGKTAFAVHAAHALAPRFPAGQIFLPLYGHTPGHRPVDPADALASLLLTAGVPVTQIPPGLEARMALWRDRLAGKQLLLLLDDAADSEQVRPLLPGAAGSLVLVTRRRHLTALEDARVISLDVLPAEEAAGLLIRLADRPDLDAGEAAVGEITRLCGYLPLAIGMLARQLYHHPTWTPAGLAADLAEARDRLDLMTAENLSITAAFDLSYQDLAPVQQQVFRCLGLHPGTDIDSYAAAALNGTSLSAARRHLGILYDQYLLTEPARGRYRMHDLIREHARALAGVDPPADTSAAVGRLLDYYLHVTLRTSTYLLRRVPLPALEVVISAPDHAPDLRDRKGAITWLSAERLNLHATAEYAAAHGQADHTAAIAAAMNAFLRLRGHWDQAFALLRIAVEATGLASDPLGHARALTDLGEMYVITNQHPAAIDNLTQALRLYRDLGNKLGEAGALTFLGAVHRLTGDYPAAVDSLTRALRLYRDLGNKLGEACGLHFLGIVHRLTSDGPAAAANLSQALMIYRDFGHELGEANVLVDLGLTYRKAGDYPAAASSLTRGLELYRDLSDRLGEANAVNQLGSVQYLTGDYVAAISSLTQALDFHHELGNTLGEANSLIFLGLAQQASGAREAAVASLDRALHLYRTIGNRLGEANTLNQMGATQYLSGDYAAAAASLTSALELYRDISDSEGEAEALNNMGDLLLALSTTGSARVHYQQAHAITMNIVAPLEEARALEGIGRCHLKDGHPDEAGTLLRQALTLYQRVGSPRISGIQATLNHNRL